MMWPLGACAARPADPRLPLDTRDCAAPPQAASLGLGDSWGKVQKAYAAANRALGDIVKVTPSSKVRAMADPPAHVQPVAAAAPRFVLGSSQGLRAPLLAPPDRLFCDSPVPNRLWATLLSSWCRTTWTSTAW